MFNIKCLLHQKHKYQDGININQAKKSSKFLCQACSIGHKSADANCHSRHKAKFCWNVVVRRISGAISSTDSTMTSWSRSAGGRKEQLLRVERRTGVATVDSGVTGSLILERTFTRLVYSVDILITSTSSNKASSPASKQDFL